MRKKPYVEGLEDDWSQVSRNPRATYSTLPSGDYTLRVKASNGWGAWSEEGIRIFHAGEVTTNPLKAVSPG